LLSSFRPAVLVVSLQGPGHMWVGKSRWMRRLREPSPAVLSPVPRRMQVLAVIEWPAIIRSILKCLGLSAAAPNCRVPPLARPFQPS